MAVRSGRGTVQRILDSTSGFALQVQSPSDVGAAIGALKLARVDILGLAGALTPGANPAATRIAAKTSVSPVVNLPDGPMLLVEHLAAPADVLRTVPDVVARRLELAGVDAATIEVPLPGGELDGLDGTPHAVVLRLFPRPTRTGITTVPAGWLDIACEWVTGDLADTDDVRLRALTIELTVPAREVSAVVHECGLARAWCDAVNGDLGDRIRTASATFGRLPHLALAAGGPAVDTTGMLARFSVLRDVAREVASEVAYACIDFESTFEGLALGLSPDGWEAEGGAPANIVARDLVSDRVPDAYPYQVLGPGHRARLDTTEISAEPLGDGRVEVLIDTEVSWLPNSPDREDARAMGWDLLRPCLVTADELDAALAEAAAAAPVDDGEPIDDEAAELEAALTASAPELSSIVLERSPHSRRGTRLTLLELVSWLEHEPHTDRPASVSPVLATYARWLGAGLGDDDRQALKQYAPHVVDTAGDEAAELSRSWRATEWLVKVQAPTWLRAAGLVEAADRLVGLGTLRDDVELVRAVDLLSTALSSASRSIGVTARLSNDGGTAEADEQAVWDAWEQASESTGWAAASEAATFGAPVELVYATDQRVIECSRETHARSELEAANQSIGNTAWAAALHAIADDAWDRGWRAADTAARELSGFTIRVEMGRVAKTVLERGDDDDDIPEGLEAAERAARESLTKAALRGGTTAEVGAGAGAGASEHPWDEACRAAESSEGGYAWKIVIGEARKAVGEDGWAQGMADARVVVTQLLTTAPDAVARVVVASVAREASSAAARGLALRAATLARSQGGDDAAVGDAAAKALERVATDLRPQAIALLDTLIAASHP